MSDQCLEATVGPNEMVYAPAGWLTWQEVLNQEDVMGVSFSLLPDSDVAAIEWFSKIACSTPLVVAREAVQFLAKKVPAQDLLQLVCIGPLAPPAPQGQHIVATELVELIGLGLTGIVALTCNVCCGCLSCLHKGLVAHTFLAHPILLLVVVDTEGMRLMTCRSGAALSLLQSGSRSRLYWIVSLLQPWT